MINKKPKIWAALLIGLIGILCGLSLLPSAAQAQYWNNISSGLWSEAVNWNTDSLPVQGSNVYINNSGTACYTDSTSPILLYLYVGSGVSSTLAIRDWGRVNVGGTYSQNALSTLDVMLTEGRSDAYVIAQSATLGGSLNVTGVSSATPPDLASDIGSPRTLILQTANGITGDFATVTIGGGTSTADYTTISAAKSADGKSYETGLYLTWYTGTALAHGDFTVDGSFTVDLSLVDQSANATWDGNSLTKKGEGTLVLSATNTYSGSTNIQAGT
jgi:autotransporter-associated beta strand protein